MHFVAPGVASRVLRAQSNTYSELICRGVKHEESSLCGCLLSVHYIRWCSENNKVSLRMCPNNGAHATENLDVKCRLITATHGYTIFWDFDLNFT